jgi:hypothetical protein
LVAHNAAQSNATLDPFQVVFICFVL